jgi:hypothetical protein
VWAPELGVLVKLPFPNIKTFERSSTPEDGEPARPPADLSAIDIAALRDALAVTETDAAPAHKAARARAQLEAAEQRGYERGLVEGKGQGFRQAIASITAFLSKPNTGNTPSPLPAAPSPSPAPRASRQATAAASERSGKAQPELRILRVLAARHPARFTRAQWATLAGMKRTGGTWQTYVSRLRTSGFIDEDGATIGATPAGLGAAGSVDRPAPGSVIQQWKSALGSGPSKMIDALIATHPRGMDRTNLADRVGMTATGGTFQTYLSRLRSNGLIDVAGRKITLTDILFADDVSPDPSVARFSETRSRARR